MEKKTFDENSQNFFAVRGLLMAHYQQFDKAVLAQPIKLEEIKPQKIRRQQ